MPPWTDYNKDGFANGTPTKFSGDYFVPGTPMEGWSVEYKTTAAGADVR
jgi:hypothetical protein